MLNTQQMIEALTSGEATKAEIAALIDKLIKVQEATIEMLGNQRNERNLRIDQQRLAANAEIDARADSIISQMDLLRAIKMKLLGETTGALAMPTEILPPVDEGKVKRLFGRKG